MLNECAARIQSYKNKDTIMCNALIEAFCVHLRNLIEFSGKKRKDYITYQYFLPENSSVTLPHNLMDKYNVKVNNLLSHLTFHRLTYGHEEKYWRLGQIANEVNENMLQFIDAADRSLLCDEIKQYSKQLESVNKVHDDSLTVSSGDYSR